MREGDSSVKDGGEELFVSEGVAADEKSSKTPLPPELTQSTGRLADSSTTPLVAMRQLTYLEKHGRTIGLIAGGGIASFILLFALLQLFFVYGR